MRLARPKFKEVFQQLYASRIKHAKQQKNAKQSKIQQLSSTSRLKILMQQKTLRPFTAKRQNTEDLSQLRNKKAQQQKNPSLHFTFLIKKYLHTYMESISKQQKQKLCIEILLLIEKIQKSKNYNELGVKLNQMQNDAFKMFKNRMTYLLFYIFRTRYDKQTVSIPLEKKLNRLIICQFYSRKLNFKLMTFMICINIHECLIEMNDFQNSRKYAKKCLKIAVVLKNTYFQYKAIEMISLLNFYEGRLNNRDTDLLTKDQKNNILGTYNEEDQMPPIFIPEDKKLQLQEKQNSYPVFQFEMVNNFIDDRVPLKNSRYFSRNFHVMDVQKKGNRKELLKKIRKIQEVGTVKKYLPHGGFINLQMQPQQRSQIYQQQVLLTHTKRAKQINPDKFFFVERLEFLKTIKILIQKRE